MERVGMRRELHAVRESFNANSAERSSLPYDMLRAMTTAVYTDGACINNQGSGGRGPGGWAWAVPGGAYASGAEADTTNQRMELTAALQALQASPRPGRVISDSKYVVDCFVQGWYNRWEGNGWKGANGKPVANQDLWRPLLEAYRGYGGLITFEWVKGHSDDPVNDIVDRLANEAARTQAGRSGTEPPTALGERDAPSSGGAHAGDVRLASISGWRVAALGLRPPALGGYDPTNPVASGVRRKLTEILTGLRAIHPDILMLTGLGLGAEQLAADAAALSGVPYVAVLAYPEPERMWPAPTKKRFRQLLAGTAEIVTLSSKQPGSKQQAGMAAARRDRSLLAAAHGALAVWDGKDRRLGDDIAVLERRIPDDVWVIPPS